MTNDHFEESCNIIEELSKKIYKNLSFNVLQKILANPNRQIQQDELDDMASRLILILKTAQQMGIIQDPKDFV